MASGDFSHWQRGYPVEVTGGGDFSHWQRGYPLTVIAPPSAPPQTQKLYLNATFDRGAWTDFTGGATNIHTHVDEHVRDDSDGIRSSLSPVTADIFKGTFEEGGLPDAGAGVLRYAIEKDVAGGDTLNAVVRLMQDTTEIASWTHTDVPNGWNLFERALSEAQVDMITDMGTLRAHIEVVKP